MNSETIIDINDRLIALIERETGESELCLLTATDVLGDSLDYIQIILEIEKEFGKDGLIEKAGDFQTIGDIAEALNG
jgi:acyl carrier protein